jgi:hypothetical protein
MNCRNEAERVLATRVKCLFLRVGHELTAHVEKYTKLIEAELKRLEELERERQAQNGK